MIQVTSGLKLHEVEGALSRVAPQHGIHVISITPFDALLSEEARRSAQAAISFGICHTELYGALLAADIRFAAFLPCRIAAIQDERGVVLESMSPRHFCSSLNRPDLDRLVAPLETLLLEFMRDAARVESRPATAREGPGRDPGAREDQVSMRRSIPQRIDCHGTKIEDLAGTGEPDAPGG